MAGMESGCESVDLSGGVTPSEAVVDIANRHATAAGIEHAEQCGQSAEVGAVSDAGRDGNDRAGHEAGDHAGEGTLHAGDDHEDIGAAEGVEASQETVQSCHPDVVDTFDVISHEIGGDCGFLGDGEIAGAGAQDSDESGKFTQGGLLKAEATGGLVMDGGREFLLEDSGVFGGDPGRERSAVCLVQFTGDGGDLGGGFPGAEDDLREPLPGGTFQIDLGESEIDQWSGGSGFSFGLRAFVCHAMIPRTTSPWTSVSR